MAAMDAEELGRVVEETNVFARVAPEHKVRILRALQDAGYTVAMTDLFWRFLSPVDAYSCRVSPRPRRGRARRGRCP
ncbi:hypothetical protein C9J85_19645 [Haloferax sp. wsp5]|nr:hypothetical protein C9J85_19645 [Haloferax sp. wsp5]